MINRTVAVQQTVTKRSRLVPSKNTSGGVVTRQKRSCVRSGNADISVAAMRVSTVEERYQSVCAPDSVGQMAALQQLVALCKSELDIPTENVATRKTVKTFYRCLFSEDSDIQKEAVIGIGWLSKLKPMRPILGTPGMTQRLIQLLPVLDRVAQRRILITISNLSRVPETHASDVLGNDRTARILGEALLSQDPCLTKSALFTLVYLLAAPVNCIFSLCANSDIRCSSQDIIKQTVSLRECVIF
jgi:hypothetical protein